MSSDLYLHISFSAESDIGEAFCNAFNTISDAKSKHEKASVADSLQHLLSLFLSRSRAEPAWWAGIHATLLEPRNRSDGVMVKDDSHQASASFKLDTIPDDGLECRWLPAMAEAMSSVGGENIIFQLENDEDRHDLLIENGKATDWVSYADTLTEYRAEPLDQALMDVAVKRHELRCDKKAIPEEFGLNEIKRLVELGANPSAETELGDAVTLALMRNDAELIEYFLCLRGIPLDRQLPIYDPEESDTALNWLANLWDNREWSADGGVVGMRLLLDAGADPNLTGKGGFLPLIRALRSGDTCQTAKTKLLLEFGADPTLTGSNAVAYSALDFLARKMNRSDDDDPEITKNCYQLLLNAAEQNGAK